MERKRRKEIPPLVDPKVKGPSSSLRVGQKDIDRGFLMFDNLRWGRGMSRCL